MIKAYIKIAGFLFLWVLCICDAQAQNFTYAEVSDMHVGYEHSLESAISTVNDINKNPNIKFVIITGDLTASGKYEDLDKAKEVLDKLNKKYYVIPGNHEGAWSPSGGTYFAKLFKHDRFKFEADGYFFIGTDCGPILRHGLSHMPQDNLNWLDSTLKSRPDQNQPVIFANHYPMNNAMDNSNEAIKILKKYNIQLILCGHGHVNRKYNFSGIPGIMCRTNLYINNQGGYNIVNVNNGVFSFSERQPAIDSTIAPWATVALKPIPKNDIKPFEPDYSVNNRYKNVSLKWEYNNELGICGGFAIDHGNIYSGTYDGYLIALNKETGKKTWSFATGGRIFATPAVSGNKIVFTSTDGYVYCINTKGKLLWKFKSEKAVVSTAVIKGNRVFSGFSDGSFRCLNLKNGLVIWSFDDLKGGFVMAPMLYNDKVYFGAWNGNLYALDQATGKLAWLWKSPKSFFYSPAFLAPVGVNNRVFIVTPDYYVTCFDAATGKIIWRETKPDVQVWFSRGLSKDSSTLYVKTRNNKGFGISASANHMQIVWQAGLNINDDATITPIVDDSNAIYFSSNYGTVIAASKKTAKTVWEYKLSNSAVNQVTLAGANEVYVSTVDGKMACLMHKDTTE